jgi:hypothetical protein
VSLTRVLPYLVFLMIGLVAAALLSSKQVSERLVSAGMLPRSVLGLMPIIVIALRVCGILLVAGGLLKIAVDEGWLNAAVVQRYALPTAMVVLGCLILWVSRKRR